MDRSGSDTGSRPENGGLKQDAIALGASLRAINSLLLFKY